MTSNERGLVVVSNCDDSGAGSLRDAIDQAADGASIDLTGLSCSVITLTSGPLAIAQDTLALNGPGRERLTITGADVSQIIVHSGTGSLSIGDLSVAHGLAQAYEAYGGCIQSKGRLVLARAAVHDCAVVGVGAQAMASGGGVSASLGLDATDATIYDNSSRTVGSVWTGDGGGISGASIALTRSEIRNNQADVCGGFSAPYGLKMRDTTIASNAATYTAAGCAITGQTEAHAIDIESSTIVDNTSGNYIGLVLYGSPPPAPTMRLVNSTVSGNTGGDASTYGAIYVHYGVLEVANSTIAFNRIASGQGAGIVAVRNELRLDSSIVADNTTYSDTTFAIASDVYGFDTTILGGASLVTYSRVALPDDTLVAEPMLLPLAYNGGRTKTHALVPASPAIDAGSNVLALGSDQRGVGYPRSVGAATDIGAVELDADHIFAGLFDG